MEDDESNAEATYYLFAGSALLDVRLTAPFAMHPIRPDKTAQAA